MQYINHAKELVRTKGCKICHVINGDGGQLGPDLTREGDKHAEEFDFTNLVSNLQTILHLAHQALPVAAHHRARLDHAGDELPVDGTPRRWPCSR